MAPGARRSRGKVTIVWGTRTSCSNAAPAAGSPNATNVLGPPTAVDRPTPEPGVCPLAPYRPFSEPLPAVSDEAPEPLVESVLAIVAVEGPVVGSRLRRA